MLHHFKHFATSSSFYLPLLGLAFILTLKSVRCAPVPNNSASLTSTEPSYKPAPRTRGTLGLLWSCLVTYGICIWTAVHKDIVPFCGLRHRIFYKILWVNCALFLPEFLLIVAVSQLRHAMAIRQHWVKRFPDTLGLQGAFFLLMGGYTVRRVGKEEAVEEEVVRDGPPVLVTLTPSGFNKLVNNLGKWEEHEIPPKQEKPNIIKRTFQKQEKAVEKIGAHERRKLENLQDLVSRLSVNPFEKEEVCDKGKADNVSKAVVSCQTLWFLVQCASRKYNQLPVTLAETHVAIQIVYAAFMYGCWWYKPLDVDRPIVITLDDDLWGLLTHQGDSDSGSTQAVPDLQGTFPTKSSHAEGNSDRIEEERSLLRPNTAQPGDGVSSSSIRSNCTEGPIQSTDTGPEAVDNITHSTTEHSRGERDCNWKEEQRLPLRPIVQGGASLSPISSNHTKDPIHSTGMASGTMDDRTHPGTTEAQLDIPPPEQIHILPPYTKEYSRDMPLVIEQTDWNHHQLIYHTWHSVMVSFLYEHHISELAGLGLSAINGLLHGLSWNSQFPSPIESVLWKISCFGLVVCPGVTYLFSLRGDCVEASIYEVWKLRFLGWSSSPKNAAKSFLRGRRDAALRIERQAKARRGGNVEDIAKPGWTWLFTVDITFYMFGGYSLCMIYFAVEAFISIRSLPKGAYDLPPGPQLLPHI